VRVTIVIMIIIIPHQATKWVEACQECSWLESVRGFVRGSEKVDLGTLLAFRMLPAAVSFWGYLSGVYSLLFILFMWDGPLSGGEVPQALLAKRSAVPEKL